MRTDRSRSGPNRWTPPRQQSHLAGVPQPPPSTHANSAAAHGDFARAVDDTYAALLRRLDGDGLIEIHPSRTNGDYVRRLGDRPELRAAVREIVREVEGVQFGMMPCMSRFFALFMAAVMEAGVSVLSPFTA